jgi:hypothetical protein
MYGQFQFNAIAPGDVVCQCRGRAPLFGGGSASNVSNEKPPFISSTACSMAPPRLLDVHLPVQFVAQKKSVLDRNLVMAYLQIAATTYTINGDHETGVLCCDPFAMLSPSVKLVHQQFIFG